jgi:hypothetical protein
MNTGRAPRVTVDLGASLNHDWISLGAGVWIPTRLLVTYEDPSRPHIAKCEFIWDSAPGQAICGAVHLERRPGEAIDAASLRLPLSTILRDAISSIAFHTGGPDAPRGTLRSQYEKEQKFVGGAHRRVRDAKDAQEGMRQRLTPEFLQRISDLYRQAVAEGKPPRIFIAETVARSPKATLAARNWIQAARRHGYLGEAVPGKAGEVVAIDRAQRSRRSNRRDRS